MSKNEFGHTNNKEYYDAALTYKNAAILDGWNCEESSDGYFILKKDGFSMHCMARTNVGKWGYQAEITIWGPDKLQIRPPNKYDWEEIREGINKCNTCGVVGNVQRVGFAGRCCSECLPKERKKQEFHGWTN